MNIINSKSNSKIKYLIKLRDDQRFRNDKSLFYVEGERILKNTPTELIDEIFIEKSKSNYFESFCKLLKTDSVYIVDDSVFEKIKDTKNSQGIVGVVKYSNIKRLDDKLLNNINTCLLLDGINDPGNLGTIIRLAEATNFNLIILANHCCNLYNTKVTRACMSSIFRLNIYISNDINTDLNLLKNHGFRLYSTILNNNSKLFNNIKYNIKSVFLFGNEANGISEDLIKNSDETIYIPMYGEIQSLNVAVSATAVCYEYLRQYSNYET